MYWHGFGMGMLPFVLMAFFWIAIVVVAVVLIVRMLGGSGGKPPGARSDTAEELLKQRYARGEITREQYETILSDLRK
jgi:putative membrane protein